MTKDLLLLRPEALAPAPWTRPRKRQLYDLFGQRLADGEGDHDEELRYAGVRVRGTGRARVARIAMTTQGSKTVRQLAGMFYMDVDDVLRALVTRPANRALIRILHDQINYLPWPGALAQARREIMTGRPATHRGSLMQRGSPGSDDRMRGNYVVPANAGTIELRINDQAWRAIEADRQADELAQRIRRIAPRVELFRSRLDSIARMARDLDTHTRAQRSRIAPRIQAVSLLQTTRMMTGTMLNPVDTARSADDRRSVQAFADRLDDTITRAQDVLVTNPVGLEFWTAGIRYRATALLGALHQPQLIRLANELGQNWDVVSRAAQAQIQSRLLAAYQSLLRSPLAERALDDLDAMIERLSAQANFRVRPAVMRNPHFHASAMAGGSASGAANVITAIALGADLGGRSVANIQGPNALVVGILHTAGPALARRADSAQDAGRLAGILFRALTRVSRLDDGEVTRLSSFVARATPESMREARSLLSSKWPRAQIGGLLVILNLVALLGTWTANEQQTLQSWAALLGSGLSAGLGAAKLVGSLERFSGVAGRTGVRVTGKVLGAAAGVLAVVSAVETSRSAFDRGDQVGGWLGVVDAGAGFLSVAGFLLTVGAANSWNGVGEVLMVIGAAIGLVTVIVGVIRDAVRDRPDQFAEQMIALFEHSRSPYKQLLENIGRHSAATRQRVEALRSSLSRTKNARGSADWWDMPLARSVALRDVDFCLPEIAYLTDKHESEVRNYLTARGKWTGDDILRCAARRTAGAEGSGDILEAVDEGGANRKLRPNEVSYLVLEGGGGKGLVFLGALQELQNRGILARLRGVGGSSAGAITALGIACGLDVAGLAAVSSQNFNLFFDLPMQQRRVFVPLGGCGTASGADLLQRQIFTRMEVLLTGILMGSLRVPGVNFRQLSQTAVARLQAEMYTQAISGLRPDAGLGDKLASHAAPYYARNLWDDLGLFPGCRAHAFLGSVIVRGGGTPTMTFADHHLHFRRKLVVTGSNMETGRTELFSVDHTPAMQVADAVRISMGLPLLFKPVRISPAAASRITDGASVAGSVSRYAGLWVDGGLWNNLPITVFSRDEAGRAGTLGIALGDTAGRRTPVRSLGEYIFALKSRVLGDEALANTSPSYRDQVISLDTGDLGTTDFSPNPQVVARLQQAAQQRVQAYF